MLQVRLYRPFAADAFLAALPRSVRAVAVLEQTKEPGAPGEPLYLDVVNTLAQAASHGRRDSMPLVIGGRYGLSSKDFNPSMAKAVFDELRKPEPPNGFTVGIIDDVTHTSLTPDATFRIDADDVVQAVFYGLGSDGTVGANKNSVKIIAEDAGLHAQGYFVYDSHKSGAQTISHLRFGPRAIHAPYLIQQASFIGCHQFQFIARHDVLRLAAPGATVLLNAPYGPDEIWDQLPRPTQLRIIGQRLRLFVIDASRVAQEVGLRGRANTVLQTCFFALSGVLPRDQAIAHIKESIRKSYGSKGEAVVQANYRAVDETLERLFEVAVPAAATSHHDRTPAVAEHAPAFVREVIGAMLEGRGDDIPVSQLPVDGTWPSGTAVWEKRNIADAVPAWNAETLHPVRSMQLRLPARRDPGKVFRRRPAGRCAGKLPFGADQRARLSRRDIRARLRDGGLHGVRALRRSLPGGAAQVARDAGQGAAAGRRTRGQRVFRRAAGE